MARLKLKYGFLKEFIFFFILIFIWFQINNSLSVKNNFLFSLTNFMIVIYSYWGAFRINQKLSFSANQIFFLFSLLFFGFAPLVQFNNDILLWGGYIIEESAYVFTNVIILYILIAYSLMYKFFSSKSKEYILIKTTPFNVSGKVITFFSILVTILIFLVYWDNLILLFFREFSDDGVKNINENIASLPTSLSLIFGLFIRPIPVLLFLIYKIGCRRNIVLEIFLLLLALLSNFPLAIPRFYVAALYLPVVILYFKNYFNGRNNLGYLFLIAVLLIFPFLNQGRTVTSLNELKFAFDFDMFGQGHFDSYINFVRVLDKEIITYGKQLLGVVLFMIPRVFYLSKPIGSGGYLASELNLDFDHISMNYFAEGYINFGFIGILLFVIFIAYLNAKFDNLYLITKFKKEFNFQNLLFLLYIGLLTFNLRGDLISSFAYTLGMFSSLYFMFNIVKKFSK
jgi:hypothetical protein